MPVRGDTFKIFIGNLSDQTRSEDLRKLFEDHGTVVECDVLKNFGFVHMEKEEERKAAIDALNGHQLHGRDIAVQPAKGDRNRQGGGNAQTKIYIGNLHKDATSNELRELFEVHGKVNEADVLVNYAFVHMDSEDEARKAIESLDGTELHGLRMAVQASTSRSEKRNEQRNKLYVGNLHKDTTSKEIRELFEDIGQVTEAEVLGNFAFVHMGSEGDARKAIDSLDGNDLHGLSMQVQMSKSRNRGNDRMSDKDSCFKCGRRGHWSNECPGGDGGRRGGRFGGGRDGGGRDGGGRFDSYGGPPPRGYDRDRMMRGMRDDRSDRYGDDPYARRPLPPMRDDPYDRRPLPPMRDDPYDRRPLPPMRDDPYDRRPLPRMRDDPYDRRPMRDDPYERRRLPSPADIDYMQYGRRSRSPPPRMGDSYGRYPPPPPPPMRGYLPAPDRR